MNSHIDEERLALYAGGDLPEEEDAEVREHVAACSRCATMAAELAKTRDLAASIANEPAPSIPADFTGRVMRSAVVERPVSPVQWRRIATWRKVAAAAAIIATVFWAGRLSKNPPEDMRSAESPAASAPAGVSVDGRFLRMLPVVGPIPADELPESLEGVYIVLYRPRPETDPDRYTVEFVGERTGDNGGDIMRNITCLLDRAGSRENIYVVLYPMPAASSEQRARVAQALIQTYKPYCNSGV